MLDKTIIAVEAGGCAPPILVPLNQREVDRAYADAGIMPLSEYVRRYSSTPDKTRA